MSLKNIINSDKYNNPLFLGWTTKSRIIDYLKSLPIDKRTWTFSWTSRIYLRCPIEIAYNILQLLEFIKHTK